MVRSISPASQAKLDQNFGTEPAFIIEIQWLDGGSIYTYSDKDISAGEGKIIEVSGLDNTVVIQGVQGGTSSDSQQISVTLDDTDGTIKDIMDRHDIHKEQAWVYQWFQGLDISEKFLIFKGQISSPIQWNEGDRTVSFDIITRIEDAEVGFSMEEGNFDLTPEDLMGESWPLIFGTVTSCQALKTRSPLKGLLKTGFGIRDYMLGPKQEQVGNVCCPWRFIGYTTRYVKTLGGISYDLIFTPHFEQEVGCMCKVQATKCEMKRKIAAQAPFEYDTIEILSGELFEQGVFIILDIDGAKISGSFNGTEENPSAIFNVAKRVHPKAVEGNPLVPPILDFPCDSAVDPRLDPDRFGGAQSDIGVQTCILPEDCEGWKTPGNPLSRFGEPLTITNIVHDSGTTQEAASWDYMGQFQEAGFFWADPGSEVRLSGDNELVYIANILPSTVHTVQAWRTFNVSNLRRLVTVPNTLYTVRQSDFGVYTTTEIVFDRPLTSRGEGWEDEIFVTLTSSVGPNTVDIMEWLITKYTSFTWDSTFATVKTRVENYPMNFMVPGRMNVFELLKDMAFQGRMALVLRDDTFHLKYLSEEPDEDGTITESDVTQNSLVLDHTNTEDLVTKMVIEWRPDCYLEDPYKVILKSNGQRYGIHEEIFDFYCYNIRELVVKSGTFWMIRFANTWRKIICQTTISKLALEGLDGCYVTLPDIANGEIKCRVETAIYNSDNHSIDFVLQTPVRAGERDPYPFHYPADISIEDLLPTLEDIQFGRQGGGGPGVDVEAPEGHVLGQPSQLLGSSVDIGQRNCGFQHSFSRPEDYSHCREDQGDQQPTDEGDVKPAVKLKEDNSEIPPSQSPVNTLLGADLRVTELTFEQYAQNSNMQGQITNNTNTGTGSEEGAGDNGGAGNGGSEGGGSEAFKDQMDTLPDPDDLIKCHYDVIITYINTTQVRIGIGVECDSGSGPVPCASSLGWCYCPQIGAEGCLVGNTTDTFQEIFAFDTIEGRDDFAGTMREILNSQATVGKIHPTAVQEVGAQPPDCDPYEDAGGGIVGYRGTGRFDGNGDELSVIGLDGFGDDDYEVGPACTL